MEGHLLLLRGGYIQQRETSSFLELETSFLVHICILGQNGEKNAKLFFTPPRPPFFALKWLKNGFSGSFQSLNP